ncbi:MAG: PDZ domain-containing protein [Sphingomonadaceae bacterium]|nr:PDZ domain-containing protein [Sphingomonadaceae bacterium]
MAAILPRRLAPGALLARGLLLLLGLGCLVQLWRIFFVFLTPIGPTSGAALGADGPTSAAAIAMNASANLFGAPRAADGAANVTALPLTLFGTRSGANGSAIIAAADGVQKSIGVGEEIIPGVRLARVAFDHVEIDNHGAREALYIDQDGPSDTGNGVAAAGVAGPVAVPASAPAAPPATPQIPYNAASLRIGLALSPQMAGGRVAGLAVRESGDGSAFAAAGFRAGDVIRAINGTPIANAADAEAFFGALRPGRTLPVSVERGGRTITLNLQAANP